MKTYKESLSNKLFDFANILIMLVICFVCLGPVLHVVFASVSDPEKVLAHSGIILWPLGFTLKGYKIIFSTDTILSAYANTLYYILFGVSISTFLTALGGYVLSRKNLLWRDAIMMLITFTMLFNGGLIPLYMVVTKLGLYNTRWAVILPTAISAFNLIIMRTSLKEVPDSLEESAKIDGANHLTIMFKIILPAAKSTVAVIVLFYTITVWNSWFHATIFLKDRDLYPLQVVLREIIISNDNTTVLTSSADAMKKSDTARILVKYCVIVAATLPVLCFYPFAQKYFVSGVMLGSIKG